MTGLGRIVTGHSQIVTRPRRIVSVPDCCVFRNTRHRTQSKSDQTPRNSDRTWSNSDRTWSNSDRTWSNSDHTQSNGWCTGPSQIVYRTQSNSVHKKCIARAKILRKLFFEEKNKISSLLKTPEKIFQEGWHMVVA